MPAELPVILVLGTYKPQFGRGLERLSLCRIEQEVNCGKRPKIRVSGSFPAPENFDRILPQFEVSGHQRHIFSLGLRNEKTVERVFVVNRQFGDCEDVNLCDEKWTHVKSGHCFWNEQWRRLR